MPDTATIERARRDKRQGKAPSTQAGDGYSRADAPPPRGRVRAS